MSLYSRKQFLQAQIANTKELLRRAENHPIMSIGMKRRLEMLTEEFESLPKNIQDVSVKLLFSGNAVAGSAGIKSSFVSKVIIPFQEMVKTQASLHKFGSVGQRGRIKKSLSTELYLTGLPRGSYGIELTQLKQDDLFDELNLSNSINEIINLIVETSSTDEKFEEIVENTPKRNLSNLKRFLENISEENSFLKMESGEIGYELSEEMVKEAYHRVASTIEKDEEVFLEAILRGILLDSGRFEIQDELGKTVSGFISEDILEDDLIDYNKTFLNKAIQVHLRSHKIEFRTGRERTIYELLEILPSRK